MRTKLTIDDDSTGVLEQNCKYRKQTIRKLAGWLSNEEAAELREAVEVFNQVQEVGED